MCGINGYKQSHPKLNNDQIARLLRTMNNKITHRGPDDEGIYVNENIGLGMRRLSIIDLATGRQPIFNENKTLVIVANGEIYNYKSLKLDLLAKGHVFSTKSDIEVVLHCYEEYGYESFKKLNGMFAFAIYDLANERIIIARDRAGEKPLYYYKDENCFLFASELKSIISTGIVYKKIDKKALNQFLQLTYIPAPLTILQDVYKLLPGHYLEVEKYLNLKIEQYWDVKYHNASLINDYDECKKRLRTTLFNAVEECMVSDVPLGAFLSGGIDSTTIVGIMSQIAKKPVDTFTIGYKDKQYDESDRAQKVSKLHKTNHHLYCLDYNDVLPELNKILDNIDEPFADSSIIPTFMVSKFARQHVKAALTGDAGDELFGGYNKYLMGFYSNKYKKIPKWLRDNTISRVLYAMPCDRHIINKARKVIDHAEKNLFEQHRDLMFLGFKQDELLHLLKENWIELDSTDIIRDYYYIQHETGDEMARAFYTDFKVSLEGDMLMKVDRASMLCSLETRAPLLHKGVIELAARIPSKFKVISQNTKIIFKDTFKDLIPYELLTASKKGFGVPIGTWFRNELKADLVTELNRNKIEEDGIFHYRYIGNILEDHFSKKKDRSSELWSLYVFNKWLRNYLD